MAQSVYKITTDQGEYNITVDDGTPEAKPESSMGGLVLKGAQMAAPAVQNAVEAVATSPTLAKNLGAVSRWGTALAAPVIGAASGGITGGLAGLAAAPKAGWAAGKAGYFGGKMVQDVAAAGAKGADVVNKSGALNTAAAAQSLLDLAQIDDPARQDIGFLGFGKTVDVNDPAVKARIKAVRDKQAQFEKDHPMASINGMANAFVESMKKAPDAWRKLIAAIESRDK